MPSFSSPFTLDTLLARCTQCEWKPDAKTMLFFNQEENALGAEQFRTLRSRLYQMREKTSLKRILVTSALPQEGKSFVSANLAQVLVRQHGRRVLLIDGDLRVARLHSALGTTSSPGLADYLLGESDEFSIMQRGSDGQPVLHSLRADSRASGRTDRERPDEDADAAGGNAV